MKQYIKYICAVLLVTGSIAHVWGSSVTFTAGSNTGSTSVNVSPITMSITGSSPGDLSGNPYKVYASKTLTFSIPAASGNITKIVITCTGTNNNDYGPKKLSGSGYTGSTSYTGTWTGNATSVSLSTSAQVRFTKVEITYVGNTCKYMYYDGSTYKVWRELPIDQVVPEPPAISGYISAVVGDGLGGVAWCTKPIPTSPCISYINNSSGDYKGCWRFVDNSGGADPDADNYPSGVDVLYPVYQDEDTYCYATGVRYVECTSPFGTLSVVGGATVTWSGSNISKTINLSGKKGSGAISWSTNVESSIATINSSGVLTIKGTGGLASKVITVTCHIAESGDYCEESKTINITVNAQTYTVTYHLTGVTKTSGPTSVNCNENDLEVYFSVNDGYTSEGIVGRVCFDDGGEWCYDTSIPAHTNIEFGTSTRLDYVNDGNFDRDIDVYIIAQEDECTDPWMGFSNGEDRVVSYGDAGWTDAATVKVSSGGASTTQEITYTSTSSAVSVSSAGAVTINGIGTATISATAAKKTVGVVKYCEKTVSYTVTVNCATPTTSANESGKEMTASVISPTMARIEGGIIVSLGGETSNNAHGYVYGTNHNPTLSNNEKGWSGANAVPYRDEGKKWGGWNITVTPGTTYYVRTYVTTDCGTGYSPTEVSFTTPNQYFITYDNNGGSGSISDQEKVEDEDEVLSDGSAFSKDGFDLQKWNTAADGSGDNYVLGATYTANANLNLFAIWTPKRYTITLDNESATSAGTASVEATMNANTNLTSAIIKPTKTGYEFGGYFTARNGGGTQIIGADGNWIAEAGGDDSYLDGSKNWKYPNDLNLYAKWTAIEIELELSANGGESDGSATVLYDATGLKAGSLTHAEYEGHTLVGYYNDDSHTLKVLSSDGSFATSSVSGYITDGKWSRTTTPTTLYAWWATEVRTVTFDLQGKGDNFVREVEYNTKVSQPANPTHIDYNFIKWVTAPDGDTEFDFNTNITANTTVYAKWTDKEYENLIFSCVDIDLDTEDSEAALVTSRNGINIMAMKKLKVNVSGAIAGHKISITGSDLKFYKNDGTRFVELTGANALTAPAVDEIVYVSYNPSSIGDGSIAAATINVSCDGFEESFSDKLKVRNLPDAVAIVSKVGNTWKALPANIGSESTPAPIMVTTATEGGILKAYGPSTVSYKLMPVLTVNSSNDRWGTATAAAPAQLYADRLRFAGNSNNGLWANNTLGNNGIRNFAAISSINSPLDNDPAYEWIAATTESDGQFVYTLKSDQPKNTNNLRLWGSKWGTFGDSYGQAEVYILPLVERIPADITIMEWGTDELAVKYANAGNVASGTFKAKIGEISPTDVTCTSLGGDIYKLTGVGNLQANPAKTLELTMTESSTAKQAIFAIPLIVTDSKTEAEISGLVGANLTEGRKIAKGVDVIVRAGGTLTTGTAEGKFADLYIYPGGKVDISRNIGVSNIYLRGGFSWLETEKDYRVPQMKVSDDVTISGVQAKGNGIYYDLHLDKRRYYMMAVPKEVLLESLLDEEGGDDFTVWLKEYNGEKRTLSPKQSGWVNISTDALLRGVGYEMSIKPRITGRTIGVLRMPLLKETAWTNEGACTPSVTAWGANKAGVTDNNKGWNFIGNPFFTAFQNTDDNGQFGTNMEIRNLVKHNDAGGNWTGTYDWTTGDDVKYITIPEKMYDDYTDVRTKNYEIDAFYPFFIQAKSSGVLTFTNGNTVLKASMPAYLRNSVKEREMDIDFYLTDNYGNSDLAGLTVSNQYSPEFDMEDKEKTIVNTSYLKVYTMVGEYRTAFNSLSEAAAALPIPVGYIAPNAGTYTISLDDGTYSNIEHIWLTDYENSSSIDLLEENYAFQTDQGQFDTRMVLNVILKAESEEILTGSETIEIEKETPLKFIYNNHIYIMRNGMIYDITGKKVKEVRL